MACNQPSPTARERGIILGFPPPADRRMDLTDWDRHPFNRWSFRNVRQMLPTRAVRHDPASVRALPCRETGLSAVAVPVPGGGTAAFPKSLVGALVGIQIGLGGIDPERRGLQLAAADAVGRALE
jgi:hypothetical protein